MDFEISYLASIEESRIEIWIRFCSKFSRRSWRKVRRNWLSNPAIVHLDR